VAAARRGRGRFGPPPPPPVASAGGVGGGGAADDRRRRGPPAALSAAVAAAAVAAAALLGGRRPAVAADAARAPPPPPTAVGVAGSGARRGGRSAVARAAASPAAVVGIRRDRGGGLAAAAPVAAAPAFGLSDRLVFAVDEFVQWNPAARLLALSLLSVALIGVGSVLFRRADPAGKEVRAPLWSAVRAYVNPMEDDWSSNLLRAVSCVNAAAGMVFFALLVGMVTEGVEASLARIHAGTSAVVASNHVVVCGWNGHVPRMLAALDAAAPGTRVVVLATARERAALDAELADGLSAAQRRRLQLMVRPGVPILKADLTRVAAGRAARILLVAPAPAAGGAPATSPAARAEADRLVLSRAVALRDALPAYGGGVLAEVSSPRDAALVRQILAPTGARVRTMATEVAPHKFLAQAMRQPGLCELVTRLMGDAPATAFHVVPVEAAAPHLVGRRPSEVSPTDVPGSILCGTVDGDGGALRLGVGNANRVGDAPLARGTRLVLLGARGGGAAGAGAGAGAGAKGAAATPPPSAPVPLLAEALTVPVRSAASAAASAPESILLVGWRPDVRATVEELGAAVPRGSTVTIVAPDAELGLPKHVGHARIVHVRGEAGRYDVLRDALTRTRGRRVARGAAAHDHVLVLSPALNGGAAALSADALEEDAKSLASLAYVVAALDADGGGGADGVHVSAELMSERVGEIAAAELAAGNVIMPRALASQLAAQAVRDGAVYRLWMELLTQAGRELYVRPAAAYVDVDTPVRASFAQLARSVAAERDDVVLGYVPAGAAGMDEAVLNPAGADLDDEREWGAGDQLIVMSDE